MLKIPKETHHFIISWRYFTEIKIIRAKYVIYSFNFELTQIFLTKTNGHQSICYLVEVQLKDLSLSLITINILLRITTKTKDQKELFKTYKFDLLVNLHHQLVLLLFSHFLLIFAEENKGKRPCILHAEIVVIIQLASC